MSAFAGESQANRKYLAFAKQAEADGYPELPNFSGLQLKPKQSMLLLTLRLQEELNPLQRTCRLPSQVRTMNILRCIQSLSRRPSPKATKPLSEPFHMPMKSKRSTRLCIKQLPKCLLLARIWAQKSSTSVQSVEI